MGLPGVLFRRLLRFLVSAAVVALPFAAGEAAALDVSNIVDEVSAESYAYYLTNLFVRAGQNRGFTADMDRAIPRVPAREHNAARDYIFSAFTNLGLSASLDPFWFNKNYTYTYTYTNCRNVVAIKPGLNPESHGVLILGAHYDSVDAGQGTTPDSPGADDNASGVAALLEAARVLSPHAFKATIVFVAFDAEEKGIRGSYHFVADHTTADPRDTSRIYRGAIRAMIAVDQIAHNRPGGSANTALILGGGASAYTPARAGLAQAVVRFGGLNVVNSGQNNGSDHGPFYLDGTYGGGMRQVDACLLIEAGHAANPWYHTTNDVAEAAGHLDLDYAAKMTRSVIGFLGTKAVLVPPAADAP